MANSCKGCQHAGDKAKIQAGNFGGWYSINPHPCTICSRYTAKDNCFIAVDTVDNGPISDKTAQKIKQILKEINTHNKGD